MEEQKQPAGVLFGSIEYFKPEDVNTLVDNLTFEQSFYILTQGIEYAYKSGIYSIQETELVSKSLRILNTELLKK
jgi:hypothetical protein